MLVINTQRQVMDIIESYMKRKGVATMETIQHNFAKDIGLPSPTTTTRKWATAAVEMMVLERTLRIEHTKSGRRKIVYSRHLPRTFAKK